MQCIRISPTFELTWQATRAHCLKIAVSHHYQYYHARRDAPRWFHSPLPTIAWQIFARDLANPLLFLNIQTNRKPSIAPIQQHKPLSGAVAGIKRHHTRISPSRGKIYAGGWNMTRDNNGGGAPRKFSLLLLFIIFVAGIVFAGLFNVGLSATNEMEFCTNCHTMKINLKELEESVHYKNASGVRATCADCHVPKAFVPKMIAKVMAAKDVYHELIGTIDTPEKYEAHRWDMASRVWAKMEANNSRECRSCHDFSQMDLAAQGRSARNRHARAEDEGHTCIDCHKGIAHELPDEPDESAEDIAAQG
jgi:cytochrome c-type protein NapC